MADNDIIRHTDIAESGVMKPFQQELIETIKILNTLDADIIKIATDIKKSLSVSDTGSSAGIKKLADDTKLANAAFTEREKVLKATREAELKLVEAMESDSKYLAQVRLELERVNAANKQAAKEQSATTGAYTKAALELARVRKAWKDLAVVQKENTAEGKALKKQLDELDATLKRVDAAAGQHQRNVGNYASGFSGLKNSINQVTREMPAFVNSAQTGFMAISNNLPMLVDSISRLKEENAKLNAEGQKGVPVWKQVVSGLFSFQTLMGVGITLMVTYGKEIGNAVMSMLGFRDATQDAAAVQKEFNKQLDEAIDRIDGLTRDQLTQIENDTKLLIIAAKKRGATQAEIDAIEQHGRDKAIAKLQDNLDRQNALLSAALTKQQELKAIDKEKSTEQTKQAVEAQENLIYQQYQRRDAAERAFEIKRQENLLKINQSELDLIEKQREEARKAREKVIKDNIKHYEELLAEMDKYAKKAKELDSDILKEMVELNEKKQKEQTKLVAPDPTLNDKSRKALQKQDEKDREKRAADEKKAREELRRNSIALLEGAAKDRQRITEKETDRQIASTERRQEALRELALKGVQDAQNSLALEEKKQAELEQKKIRQQKNAKRQEILFAGLKAYSANVESNSATALTKTLKDITVLTSALAAIPTFIEGTEKISESLGKPHLPGRDGYIVRVDGEERILNPEQNRKIGDMTNDELTNLAQMAQMGIMPSVPMAMPYHDDRQLNKLDEVSKGLKEVQRAIENKPVQSLQVDEIEKLATVVSETKYKTERTSRKIGGYGR